MATANTKHRAPRTSLSVARPRREERLEFRAYPDNGGRYAWEIIDEHGTTLAHCAGFDTSEEAERAADRVQHGAGSALLAFDPPAASQRAT
jgi:hypothetical protein